jgi:hypothetical protein
VLLLLGRLDIELFQVIARPGHVFHVDQHLEYDVPDIFVDCEFAFCQIGSVIVSKILEPRAVGGVAYLMDSNV